jgi:prepilin-type N-terminal cleavage/methylation domain-containing protein
MRNPRAGLTLMEVLVAIALLSLLSVGILTAMRVGSTAWRRANADLMLDRRIAAANSIFHAELEGIFPAWAEFQDPATRISTVFVFFQGQPQSMRFVTSYSLDSGPRGGLRIVEMQVTSTERGQRVLLNEQIYGEPRTAGRLVTGTIQERGGMRLLFAPIVPQPSSFVIADELGSCAFSYRAVLQLGEPEKWTPEWSDQYKLPTAISIQITPRGDSARLHAVTVTVPIRSVLSAT